MIDLFKSKLRIDPKNCVALIKKGIDSKIKSQRVGAVDVYLNQRVKWPHEFVLARTSTGRLNYNQLNITQWMAGFCRIMRDEENLQTKGHMLDYLVALLDDSNDFRGRQRKLVMQYCYVEWSKVKLLAVQRQKKLIGSKEQMHRDIHPDLCLILLAKNSKNKVRLIRNVPNQCHLYISMTTVVPLLNTMKQKGCFISIFAVIVLRRMAR